MTYYSRLPFSEQEERERLREGAPSLGEFDYQPTSASTPGYNCVAWAAGDDTKFWSPDVLGGYYWPDGLPCLATVGVLEQLFRREGYERCPSLDAEPGREKIAIYGDEREAQHVARQLSSGEWTSKMGVLADVSHPDPRAVEAPLFGTIQVIMSRPTTVEEEPEAERELLIVSRERAV